MNDSYLQYLSERRDLNLLRILPIRTHDSMLDFLSNDYLGLSRDPRVIEESIQAAQLYGIGATGSRLLSGNAVCFEAFERRIAQDKKTESALIFNSGFQANVGALSTLCDEKILKKKPIVFFDKCNHASLYQAIFLSQAECVRYAHNDMNHLEHLLKKYRTVSRPKWIVTETIFGMDGDTTPLHILFPLAQSHHAAVYLDEAHATGIAGKAGYGYATEYALDDVLCVIMGTFSKALGCQGAYVASSNLIREVLINHSKNFIYSTALSPVLLSAAFRAWRIVPELDSERLKIQHLGRILRSRLHAAGLQTGFSTTHIVPVLMKNVKQCMHLCNRLLSDDIAVAAVRPPTSSSARLRVTLKSTHTECDIDRFMTTLCAAL